VEIEFEKDICGDPRIQPGSLVSPSKFEEISIALLAHIILLKTKNGAYKYENIM